MLRSAIDVLAVFDLNRPDPPPVALEAEPPIEPLGYSVAEEIERRVAEAEATVRAQEQSDYQSRLAEALAEQARALRAEHEAERKLWVEEQSERFATAIDARFTEIGEQLGAAAARALRPFLVERLVDRSVEELAICVGGLMTDGTAPPLEIKGPADLLDRLAERLGENASAISFHPGEQAEIVVTTGETMIETRLRDWVARLLHSEE